MNLNEPIVQLDGGMAKKWLREYKERYEALERVHRETAMAALALLRSLDVNVENSADRKIVAVDKFEDRYKSIAGMLEFVPNSIFEE